MWFLETQVFNKMDRMIKAGAYPDQEKMLAFTQNYKEKDVFSEGFAFVSDNGIAQLNIEGVLTKKPDLFASFFGGNNATYQDIINALSALDKDNRVNEIVLNIDSPGGQVEGMFEAMYAIRDTKKPIKAIISGLGASAAYGLASQADSIEALSDAVFIGSIGTAATFYTDEDIITITSTNAPKKRPDVTTEEGKAVVQEELDAIADLFVEVIAQGRKTSQKNVNENYGQGGTFLATEALKRGMIDSIATAKNHTKNNLLINNSKVKLMDLKTLQLQHPALFAKVQEMAVEQERDRVNAHLVMGEASGDIKTAIDAVKNGSAMTETLRATYMKANMNKRDIDNRLNDEADIQSLGALSNNDLNNESSSDFKKVVDLVAQRFGVN